MLKYIKFREDQTPSKLHPRKPSSSFFHASRSLQVRPDVVVHSTDIYKQENKHGSKRDIYYMHPAVFSDQSVVDWAINDICILMRCSRHNLNAVSVGNGLVMGWLRFSESQKILDCINRLITAHPIPIHVEEVKDVVSVAQYILVVEKESVFQRMANDQFCSKNRCIVITGRGYPDIPTRRFLRLLIDTLHLPAYFLVTETNIYSAAEPLFRLIMGFSMLNLDVLPGLAPFEL
ncbi:meiotic recombination protein SPO11-1-like [Humulus lupulus]|uniref:meiotic recombination protein SPO11-1-like n=1 Tax=Humulus lupulus TaxID=3486 RepID=UPI002B40C04F|nr:meiotic recombination protein SPO11-1-like [Humulus lupulus]